jgi:hypothetical protein
VLRAGEGHWVARRTNRIGEEDVRMSANIAAPASDPTDEIAAITSTVEDYFLGWYDGDADRMRRALHPDLAKRSFIAQGGKPALLRAVTAHLMIGWTSEGEGRETDAEKRRLSITVDDVHDGIAAARVDSYEFREYVHLVKTPDGWRIANTLWTWSDPSRHKD